MSAPQFQVLDWQETPLGPLCLRRRELLGRPGTFVTEVTLDHEMLMSSLHTASEEALATKALELHEGRGLRVLVGGLGLGYTARAALASERVAKVRVIEYLPAVIGWLEAGLIPLAGALSKEPRLEVVQADVYGLLLGAAVDRWDLILIDVDHSPDEPLGSTSRAFYEAPGLARVARHLAPRGVLAVWSAGDDDPEFAAALRATFPEVAVERVTWTNELVDEGREVEDVLFLARRSI
jgi:spermidine synthase